MCASNMFSGDADTAGPGTTQQLKTWGTPSEGSGPNLTRSQTKTQKLDRLLIPFLSVSGLFPGGSVGKEPAYQCRKCGFEL